MKKTFILFLSALLLAGSSLKAQEVKNVIVMIPDGCSTELLAIGRWMQNSLPLNVDRCLKGLCKTYCSDSPIGDSAPTGSTYATGHRSQDGYVATAPAQSMTPDGVRFAVGADSAYHPMATLLEAAKLQGKATGEVFTCFFTHATPADFIAHTPNRNDYFRIAKQMTAFPPDVMLGGGSLYIDSALARYGFNALERLEENGIFYTKDFDEVQKAARQGQTKIWGFFAEEDMEFEIDRARDVGNGHGPGQNQPHIADMTRQAIEILSQNPEGFFLMVEGSKIDWANHDNDLPASVYDFLAFDKAVGVALDFAEQNGETLVIILPDHQTGGLSLGGANHHRGYARLSYEQIFGPLKAYQKSCDRAVRDLITSAAEEGVREKPDMIKALLIETLAHDFAIDRPTEEEVDYASDVIFRNGAQDSGVRVLCRFINRYNSFDWTTYGHNGGDVFFSMYHPQAKELSGVISNEEIAPYAAAQAGLGNLDSLSRTYYAPLARVFEGKEIVVVKPGSGEKYDPECVQIKKAVKNLTLTLYPNSTKALLGKKEITLPGRFIYNGKGYYLPAFTLDTLP